MKSESEFRDKPRKWEAPSPHPLSKTICYMSNEKRPPGCSRYIGDEIHYPVIVGIIFHQYEDLVIKQPVFQWKVSGRFVFFSWLICGFDVFCRLPCPAQPALQQGCRFVPYTFSETTPQMVPTVDG